MMVYGIELSVFAVLGGFVGGWLDNHLGSKRAHFVSVGGTLAVLRPEPDDGAGPHPVVHPLRHDVCRRSIRCPSSTPGRRCIFLLIVNGVAVSHHRRLRQCAHDDGAPCAARENDRVLRSHVALGHFDDVLRQPLGDDHDGLDASQRGGMLAIMGFLAVGLILMAFVKEERAVAV